MFVWGGSCPLSFLLLTGVEIDEEVLLTIH